MKELKIRLIGALNDFLPKDHPEPTIRVAFQGSQTYKHLIESLGVPHPEIAEIRVNGNPDEVNQIALEDCTVEVFPYQPGDPRIRPEVIRFVLDGHLGKLTSYLRLLGFDVDYRYDADDPTLAEISATENRILLTRDRGLLKRNQVHFGYWIRAQDPRQQLVEVIRRYGMAGEILPFSRCPKCNGVLHTVEKAAVLPNLLPQTRVYYDRFWQCPDCGQIYWQGSHYQHLQTWLNGFLANP
ncbi:uncharacterized conserved protein [Longilinea arvoryzae]|uniref:Uncharacterized conserved protein n=1 Tax=Longilinea arvoryzae TaxID=360412 RepID=A0A0S7BAA6_9CHLR|nr:Mut7-C RNAse domain-containing protein [Longilinea arvoryzae]GAP14543.1 uncharacterized conserved protein [Longilinea arvoryzae]